MTKFLELVALAKNLFKTDLKHDEVGIEFDAIDLESPPDKELSLYVTVAAQITSLHDRLKQIDIKRIKDYKKGLAVVALLKAALQAFQISEREPLNDTVILKSDLAIQQEFQALNTIIDSERTILENLKDSNTATHSQLFVLRVQLFVSEMRLQVLNLCLYEKNKMIVAMQQKLDAQAEGNKLKNSTAALISLRQLSTVPNTTLIPDNTNTGGTSMRKTS